jgi:hypothetical protein
VELYLHSSNTTSWLGAQLKHRDNFAFYLYIILQIVFNFTLQYIIRNVQGKQEAELNGLKKLLLYADDVNLFGGKM